MTTITKERIELFIKNPLENGLTRGEQMELARIALASLEAEPVAECIVEDGGMCIDGFGEYVGHSLPDGTHQLYTAPPAQVVPDEMYWQDAPVEGSSKAAAYATGWNACRAAMLQGADGNSPAIPDAYDIEAFGVFSATEGENGLMLQIERFRFGTGKCPQIGKENMVPKFALQAIINRLQEHCDSMGNEALVDILSTPAAPQQEVK